MEVISDGARKGIPDPWCNACIFALLCPSTQNVVGNTHYDCNLYDNSCNNKMYNRPIMLYYNVDKRNT